MVNTKFRTIINRVNRTFTFILVGIFTIIFFALLHERAYISALFFLLADLMLFAFLFRPKFLKSKILNSRIKRIMACFTLVFVGLVSFPLSDKDFRANIKTAYAKENFNQEKLSKRVFDFVSKNKNDAALKNADSLIEINNLFSDHAIPAWSFSNAVFVINKDSLFALYKPFTSVPLMSKKYLKPIANFKNISDFQIKFNFNLEYEITAVTAIVLSDNSPKMLPSDFSFTDYYKQDVIRQQRREIEEKENIIALNERKRLQTEKFKESCLSAWDGSCHALESYVKRNMNDPDSYEHIETVFWNMGDYAVILMKYRGKNAFGGKVVNAIKAKVSWDCELIEIIETFH